MRNAGRFVDAQTDEGEDAQFGVQLLFGAGMDAGLGHQQGVELLDEVGEEGQKGGVEVVVKAFLLLLHNVVALQLLQQCVRLMLLEQFQAVAAVVVEFVNVVAASVEIACQVFLLHLVGQPERGIRRLQFSVGPLQGAVGLLQVLVGLLQLGVGHGLIVAQCGEFAHLLPQREGEGRHEEQQRYGAVEYPGLRAVALCLISFVGAVDDGKYILHLAAAQTRRADGGILHGAEQVFVGPRHVALLVQHVGQVLQGHVLSDAALQVGYGSERQVVARRIVLPECFVGAGQWVANVGVGRVLTQFLCLWQ